MFTEASEDRHECQCKDGYQNVYQKLTCVENLRQPDSSAPDEDDDGGACRECDHTCVTCRQGQPPAVMKNYALVVKDIDMDRPKMVVLSPSVAPAPEQHIYECPYAKKEIREPSTEGRSGGGGV